MNESARMALHVAKRLREIISDDDAFPTSKEMSFEELRIIAELLERLAQEDK